MASKRRKRRKSCEGKVRHSERRDATRQMTKTRSKADKPMSLHVYKCGFCGGHHVGHWSGSGRANKGKY